MFWRKTANYRLQAFFLCEKCNKPAVAFFISIKYNKSAVAFFFSPNP